MKKIVATTAKLLEAVKENYEKHKKEYKEALDAYKVVAVEEVKEMRTEYNKICKEFIAKVENIKEDEEIPVLSFHLKDVFRPSEKPPVDHSEDYETAIKMLEFETSETIEIELEDFQRFVMDLWKWKADFSASRSTIMAKFSEYRDK